MGKFRNQQGIGKHEEPATWEVFAPHRPEAATGGAGIALGRSELWIGFPGGSSHHTPKQPLEAREQRGAAADNRDLSRVTPEIIGRRPLPHWHLSNRVQVLAKHN